MQIKFRLKISSVKTLTGTNAAAEGLGLNSEALMLNLKLEVDLAAGFAASLAGELVVAGLSIVLVVTSGAGFTGSTAAVDEEETASFGLGTACFSSFGLPSLPSGDFLVLDNNGTRSGGTGTFSLKV